MEINNGRKEWRFNNNKTRSRTEVMKKEKQGGERLTVRSTLKVLEAKVNLEDERVLVPLGHGDPSPFSCFRTPPVVEDAVVHALRSARFNGYTGPPGLLPARKAVAEYISSDLPYKLSPDDVHLTMGCKQAIQAVISALAHSNANILLPMPGFGMYDAAATYSGLEIRNYNLLQDKGWEVDLDSVEAVADDNTAAIVVINPGNPCGTVYTHQQLEKVAETARKLGLLVIVDEVYEHITFGSNPFVRMGVFASMAPVITLGSISKRWMVPGWRLGWLVTTDPNGILQKSELLERIKAFLAVSPDPVTFIQGAVPQIIEKTTGEFFSKVIDLLRQDADIIFEKLEEIPCITCPKKPEGSMFVMAKLNLSLLDGIQDDLEFCLKLAEEEKVIVLPGSTMGMKDWVRITFALDPSLLEEGLERIKVFCQRKAKEQ